MFEIKPITRTFKAKALTNPFPSYVSLVKAGANQRPIRAIKMDGFASEENSDMKIQRADAKVAALITTGFDLVSLSFDKASFADTAAVKAWLDDGGYADYEIVDTTKGFEVVNSGARVETGTARKVQAGEGVSAFVARTTLADPVDEPAPVEGETEITAKADDVVDPAATGDKPAATLGAALTNAPGHLTVVDAEVSDDELAAQRALADSGLSAEDFDKLSPEVVEESVAKAKEAITAERAAAPADATVQPVAANAVDEPGTGLETPEEVTKTADEVLIDKAEAAIVALTAKGAAVPSTKGANFCAISYIADVIQTLRYTISDAEWNGISETVVEKLKDSARAALEAFVVVAGEVADGYAEVLKTDATVDAVAEPAAPAIDMAAVARMIGDAVTNAIAPVSEAVAGVTSQVEALSTSVKADKDDLTQRVEALSQRGQARKGAPSPVTNERTPDTEAKPAVKACQTMLSAMGSRHGRG